MHISLMREEGRAASTQRGPLTALDWIRSPPNEAGWAPVGAAAGDTHTGA